MATPSPRPWAITLVNQTTQQYAITDSSGATVVTFAGGQTTSSLLGGLLTTVLTPLGVTQSQVSKANAEKIVAAVNNQIALQQVLRKIQATIDQAVGGLKLPPASRKTVADLILLANSLTGS